MRGFFFTVTPSSSSSSLRGLRVVSRARRWLRVEDVQPVSRARVIWLKISWPPEA